VAKTVQIGSHDSGSVGADGEENRVRSAEFERQLVIQPVLLDAPIELSDALTHDHTPSQWLQFRDHPAGKTSGHPGPVNFVTHGRQTTEIPYIPDRPQQVAEDLFPRLPAAAAVDSDIV
jgi:hypothetical protein